MQQTAEELIAPGRNAATRLAASRHGVSRVCPSWRCAPPAVDANARARSRSGKCRVRPAAIAAMRGLRRGLRRRDLFDLEPIHPPTGIAAPPAFPRFVIAVIVGETG